jgi:peptide/nickel transport system ATP-binding protein
VANGVHVELVSGAPVVEEFSLEISRGQVVGLVGESGSGKTTAGLALLGYARRGMRITSGQVLVKDRDLLAGSSRDVRRLRGGSVSYVPQDPAASLNPAVGVRRQLELVANAHGIKLSESSVLDALDRVGLPASRTFAQRFPHQLSGGQQQRVAIAKAMICEPAVVVMDEPTTGLDVITQARVLAEISRICQDSDVGIVYISHDLAVVAQVSSTVLVMYAGRIVEYGPAAALIRHPEHPYTRALVLSSPDHLEPRRLAGIRGTAVGVGDRPPGCAFAPRCPQRHEICDEAMPNMTLLSGGRAVRCYLHEATPATSRIPADMAPTPLADAPLLDVRSLHAEHGRGSSRVVAVRDVSFSVGAGECVAIVGESGSGKTTLGRCLAGLHTPSSGVVELAGEPLPGAASQRSRRERRAIQIVFQNPYDSLNPRHRVGLSIERTAIVLRGLSRRDAGREVSALLERVQLPATVASRFPRELSGGECQRVALARALGAKPDLIVCDEVTSALDVSVQANVLQLLSDLQAELGLALVFISHDLGVVASVSRRILVMAEGEIREEGLAGDVLQRPSDPYTKSLLVSAPRLEIPTAVGGGSE